MLKNAFLCLVRARVPIAPRQSMKTHRSKGYVQQLLHLSVQPHTARERRNTEFGEECAIEHGNGPTINAKLHHTRKGIFIPRQLAEPCHNVLGCPVQNI